MWCRSSIWWSYIVGKQLWVVKDFRVLWGYPVNICLEPPDFSRGLTLTLPAVLRSILMLLKCFFMWFLVTDVQCVIGSSVLQWIISWFLPSCGELNETFIKTVQQSQFAVAPRDARDSHYIMMLPVLHPTSVSSFNLTPLFPVLPPPFFQYIVLYPVNPLLPPALIKAVLWIVTCHQRPQVAFRAINILTHRLYPVVQNLSRFWVGCTI